MLLVESIAGGAVPCVLRFSVWVDSGLILASGTCVGHPNMLMSWHNDRNSFIGNMIRKMRQIDTPLNSVPKCAKTDIPLGCEAQWRGPSCGEQMLTFADEKLPRNPILEHCAPISGSDSFLLY